MTINKTDGLQGFFPEVKNLIMLNSACCNLLQRKRQKLRIGENTYNQTTMKILDEFPLSTSQFSWTRRNPVSYV